MKSLRLAFLGLVPLVPALTAPAVAEENWYVSLRGGVSMAEKSALDNELNGLRGHSGHDDGLALGAAVGYDFGGVRLEGELLRLNNSVDNYAFSNDGGLGASLVGRNPADTGSTRAMAGMANLYYDMDFGGSIIPYVGAGLGWGSVKFKNYRTADAFIMNDRDSGVVYQLIGGMRAKVSEAVDVTVDYRYVGSEDPNLVDSLGRDVAGDYSTHVVMVGLVWKFGGSEARPAREEPMRAVQREPEPAPAAVEPAAGPEPEPEPEVVEIDPFVVYFDWDSDELTAEARREITRAASAVREHQPVQLLVKGHADTSGAATYNQELSERRAERVQNALINEGVSRDVVKLWGYGEDRLSVWTEDNTREGQNRRVEIILDMEGE